MTKTRTLTLEQMLETVDTVPAGAPVPTAAALIRSESPVADKLSLEDLEIKVYQNGYVLYTEGGHSTVFPLQKCREYVETDAMDEKHVYPYEAFAGEAWHVRVLMEGNDRISHNRICRDAYAGVISHDGFAEGGPCLSDKMAGDPLTMMVEEADRAEEYARLHHVMDTALTSKQRFVLTECVGKGRMQADVAKELGVSRGSVTGLTSRGLIMMRTEFGTEGQSFGRNYFYRPGSVADGN